MKKIPARKRRYITLLAKRRFRRRWLEKVNRKAKRKSQDAVNAECFYLQAPRAFSAVVVRERRELLRFLSRMRKRILVHRKPLKIDFRRTDKMISCGTLLFIAELDRCIRATGGKVKVGYVSPRNKIVDQVIHQVGISSLLGRKTKVGADFDKSVRHWRFATGVHADATDFDKVLGRYEGRIATALSKSIFKGVTEAMTNCAQHAYEESRRDGMNIRQLERRWWMFSQEDDGILSVAFCDLGMGIPRSLPRVKGAALGWFKRLDSFLSGFSIRTKEAALIKAAIEIGQTRTDKDYRGLGLNQIVETAKVRQGSHVLILSNAGGYLLQPDRLIKEQLVQYDDSILGTLIQWNMPIAGGEVHDGAHSED